MNARSIEYVNELTDRYPVLNECRDDIVRAYGILDESFSSGGKLLVCGNGGSSSDSEHMVGELMKGFALKRKVNAGQADAMKAIDPVMGATLAETLQGALPAICLTGHTALTTAFMNDADADLAFAQQVNGYGNCGDAFLGISTSGNSRNVCYAAITAKARGLKVIGLTGRNESRLSELSDVCIRVPETVTYRIQELHLPVYHCLCLMLEERFFGE